MMADSGDHVGEHVEAFDSKDHQLPKEDGQTGENPAPGGPIQNDEAHLDPSRWWLISSAFPMIAGTLGPVASAFSICALVKPWRQKFPPGSNVVEAEFIPDPIWLTVVNAIQVAMALVANLVLLLNMARKIRFAIAQPVTIVTWYISSICLLALNATAAGPLLIQPESLYIWSQAFYYGIYAACLYFLCSSLMVVTFWGAQKGHYAKDFQLTASQRTLMLQTIMFLIYLLLGALVFSKIEGWQFLDGVYWADVTLFTVGFGDFAAETTLGRALLFPYALVGVISLGLVVGSIRSLVLERGRRQLGARMVEKKRKRMLKQMMSRGKDDILIPVTDDEADRDSPERTLTGLTELERRRKEFELMRNIQNKAEYRRRWMAMGTSTAVWLILWLVGAAIFQQTELRFQGWNYFDGFYFAFVSLTTIGYGDRVPISPAGKSFFVFWSLLALPTMTILISNAGDTVVKFIRDATDKLGQVTILPGEGDIQTDVKRIVKLFPLGRIFSGDSGIEESPPGILGDAEKHIDASEGDEEKQIPPEDRPTQEKRAEDNSATIEDPSSRQALPSSNTTSMHRSAFTPVLATASTGHPSFREPASRPSSSKKSASESLDTNSQTAKMSRAVSMSRNTNEITKVVLKDRNDYLVTLIKEIRKVTGHLKHHPPKRYQFHEWAWFLKLIGEDESNAERHKKPVTKSRKKNDQSQELTGEDQPEKLQWSWVGSRSPLMGSQEEAEWILEKLQQKLAEELTALKNEVKG